MNFSVEFPKNIITGNSPNELTEHFVDYLELFLKKRLLETVPKPIGLATGRTMIPIYKSLVERLLSWPTANLKKLLDGWTSFNLDEYVGLSDEHKGSFKNYMRKHFGDPIGLDFDKIRIPDSLAKKPQDEAFEYSKDIEKSGGIGLQILGLGSNGHVGFNEPPCSFKCSCRVETLSLSTRRQNAFAFDNDIKSVPKSAITLGLKEILASDEIHLIVTGSEKIKIFEDLLNSSCSPRLPASWLRLHPKVYIWADENLF